MDLVLGLSMASDAIRWVLVEGSTGEGAPVDRGALNGGSINIGDLLDGVASDRLHAVGVSWTPTAGDAASGVLKALADRGIDNVVVVSDVEAAEALAGGIAELSGYGDLAVCIVEPEVVLVALCGLDGVTVDRVSDGGDVVAMLNPDERDAIFVVGSGDHEPITVALADSATPVITATEAEFALARGVALASARAVNGLDAQAAGRHRMAPMRALPSVLAAAVVTFVVSLSVAIGLQLTPDPDPGQRQVSTTADQRVPVAEKPSAPKLAPPVPRPAAPPAPKPAAPPRVAETIAVAVPPAPAAVPVAPAYVPPAPAYVPPAPPAYVPPAQAPPYVPPAQVPQPRLRDRIIERIPILNRFHEPEYQYPGQ